MTYFSANRVPGSGSCATGCIASNDSAHATLPEVVGDDDADLEATIQSSGPRRRLCRGGRLGHRADRARARRERAPDGQGARRQGPGERPRAVRRERLAPALRDHPHPGRRAHPGPRLDQRDLRGARPHHRRDDPGGERRARGRTPSSWRCAPTSSCSPSSRSRRGSSRASSAAAWPCGASSACSTAWRRRTPRCCSRARRGRARRSSPAPSCGGAIARPRSSSSTAARSRTRSSRASFSGTSAGPSPGPSPSARAPSRAPTGARSSSTRSASCRSTCSRCCCGCSRRASSAGWAATRRSARTCESSPRRAAISSAR